MTVPVLITAPAITKLIHQTYGSDLIPVIQGRLGSNNFLHACYAVRLTGTPTVIISDDGSMTVRVPVEGHLSIPWGLGVKFNIDAEAELRPELVDGGLRISIGEITYDYLSLGEGCSLPPELLRLMSPFIRGVIFPSKEEGDGGSIFLELPAIPLPLGMVLEGAPDVHLVIEDLMVFGGGIVLFMGLPGDRRRKIPPRPPGEGFDIIMAIPEEDVESLVALALSNGMDIAGESEIAIPDQTRLVDMLKASGETLTSFGRRGLGRRALKSSSRLKLTYSVRPGVPQISFQEGNKVLIHDVPGHIIARAVIEMDMPETGLLYRLRNLFSFKEKPAEAKTTKATVTDWNIDEDFTIKKVVVEVGTTDDGKPDMKVTDLDIDLTLHWALPERTIEEIIEIIGKRVATAELPKQIPSEVVLSSDLPVRIILEKVVMSTMPGTLNVLANMSVGPSGPPEVGRGKMKELIEDRVDQILEQGLK